MTYIETGKFSVFKEEGEIYVNSRSLVRFFRIDHVTICNQITKHKKQIGKLFIPSYIYNTLNNKKEIFRYDITRRGCLLLMKSLKAPKEDKKSFLNIICAI